MKMLQKSLELSASPPPIPDGLCVGAVPDPTVASPPPLGPELQPISGFMCFIDYEGITRRIICRRFDLIGELGYIGANCLSARGYRQFRTDRIETVLDALTGEVIGDGSFFFRFAVDSKRGRSSTWGLSDSQRASLIAGLNVLAFIARCDGRWHPLEDEPIERFVCSMWLRKEWPDDPPIREILNHAQRLTPDAEIFFKGLRHYAQSSTSTAILRQAVAGLIEADGVIVDSEFEWALAVDEFFRESDQQTLEMLDQAAHHSVLISLPPANSPMRLRE